MKRVQSRRIRTFRAESTVKVNIICVDCTGWQSELDEAWISHWQWLVGSRRLAVAAIVSARVSRSYLTSKFLALIRNKRFEKVRSTFAELSVNRLKISEICTTYKFHVKYNKPRFLYIPEKLTTLLSTHSTFGKQRNHLRRNWYLGNLSRMLHYTTLGS